MPTDDTSSMLPEIKPSTILSVAELSDLSSPAFANQYNLLINCISQLTDIKKSVDDKIKTLLEAQYQETGDSSCEYNGRRYTYVPPTTRVTVDTKKLQSEQPDVYAKYARVTSVSASLKSSLKQDKEDKE